MLVLDRWISSVQQQTAQETGLDPSDPAFTQAVDKKIGETIGSLDELVHGFDFAQLLEKYYRASLADDKATKSAVLKWFRGEYERKTDAKNELGVSVIISDDDWYDYLKLFAVFFRQAGYAGLYIMIDELVNLSKIPNAISRQYNYEKILAIYNDVLQGKARYLGVLMCGTRRPWKINGGVCSATRRSAVGLRAGASPATDVMTWPRRSSTSSR